LPGWGWREGSNKKAVHEDNGLIAETWLKVLRGKRERCRM